MKKQLVIAVALAAILNELHAGLLENTLDTAGNLTNEALNVPGDVVHGTGRTNRRERVQNRRGHLFGRRQNADQ